ncbi:MAG: signal peptidase II [Elusimicrobiota bacterium]
MRKKSVIIILAILLIDQFTKFYIAKNFLLGESVSVIRNIFHITYITNTGTAFGMFQDYGRFFLIFSIIAIILLSIFIYKKKDSRNTTLTAFSLILGGAWGNLIDRIIRGSIVDFLDFRIWPIFNIADSAITIGIGVLVIHSIFLKIWVLSNKQI